ncbi:adenosylcobinamide-GDP ribazoletransferase [Massilia sp. Root335]|jgi:adenosylcobinamide-GDP ribazoletransferase|uniref:adenosylcobinamide-GDP ribazoletransferase n=1 Tax=Massilia sp. Root335 TaxID=1736517 RepID=UPI0006F8E644|nr:adenosylcobinamide-GDP ribazoletransferase [Massilia sp. Root335]KQV41478.1 cobalamin synthase [Massilia sp. Root335]
MQQLRLFFIALQFFTRLPIPGWVGFEASWLQHASRYFPLVGVVVASIAAAVYYAAALVLPGPVAAVLSTAASIWITGAFHEDGFADTCDGLGGGMTKERALEIMKDSRVGAYGAIGIVCMLATKLSALALLPPRVAVAALFVAHPFSRLAATALIWKLKYVRGEGKAKPLAQQMTTAEFAIAALTCALPPACVLALGWMTPAAMLAAVLAALAAALWLGRLFVRRLGGYTGDCLGAVQQLAEALAYLAVLATLGHGAWTAA